MKTIIDYINENKEAQKLTKDNFVDLGLSVKWANHNLEAKHNKTLKSWVGNYYSLDDIEMNDFYHIPTKDEAEELLDTKRVTRKWQENYNGIEGLNGCLLTSNSTGNTIFIPAGGIYENGKLKHYGKICFIWCSRNSKNEDIVVRFFDDGKADIVTILQTTKSPIRAVAK